MSLASVKVELAKNILETENKDIIKHIKAVFDSGAANWYAELPSEIQASVDRGLQQSAKGESIPHKEVMEYYKKWQKK